MAPTPAVSRDRGLLVLASVLFFLSGAAGLAYEVVWFRRFAHAWGSSPLALGSVVASFLLGLGLGARVLGGLAARVPNPLLWYGLAEIAVAALALLVPLETAALQGLAAAIYPAVEGAPVARALLAFAATFLVLGPPCFLMGGTLPLLVRRLGGPDARDRTAWLYAVNTLGAAAGCALAGFLLLPSLGLAVSNLLAAGTSAAAGLAAVAAAGGPGAFRSLRPLLLPCPAPAAGDPPPGRPDRAVEGAALLVGAAALLLQVAWTRELSLVLGGSTYAFTAAVLVVLVGIGAGSLLHHLRAPAWTDPRRTVPWVLLAFAASVWAGQAFVPDLCAMAGAAHDLRATQGWNAVVSAAAAAALELAPSAALGMLFPLLVARADRAGGGVARAAGRVYAANSLGAILGALGGTLWVVPAAGTAGAAGVAVLLGALGASLASAWRPRRAALPAAAAALAALVAAGGASRPHDPRLTNAGLYLYGYRTAEVLLEGGKVVLHREGPACTVTVLQDRDRYLSLRVNGKVDASTGSDMETQLGLAYLPRFLRPRAERILVVGFGSGTTAGASLLFPGTRVTCCEIEPGVLEAAPLFADWNHSPHRSDRFRAVVDDGRAFVQGSRERFHLIVSEPSNPWIAGVSSLFTREFYAAARARLEEGGLLAQWVQAYSFAPADFAIVVRTVRSEFRHAALLRVDDYDSILVGSDAPILPGAEGLEETQRLVDSLPEVRADLVRWMDTADVRSLLLRSLLLDDAGVLRLLATDGPGGIHTDANLRLEFDTPLRLFGTVSRLPEVVRSLVAAAEPRDFRARYEAWGCGEGQDVAVRTMAELYEEHGFKDRGKAVREVLSGR